MVEACVLGASDVRKVPYRKPSGGGECGRGQQGCVLEHTLQERLRRVVQLTRSVLVPIPCGHIRLDHSTGHLNV
jgi:hypothetical protein